PIEPGGAEQHAPHGAVFDPRSLFCIRINRWAVLRELGSDTEGAVEKKAGRPRPIKLGAEIVATEKERQAVIEQSLLDPGLLDPRPARSSEVAHALRIAGEIARLAAVDVQALGEYGQSTAF